jgi:hypothetical protein
MTPLSCGKRFRSPGGSFAYEVVGPVCRLFDREELPWPSCSLQWKGKQPSWRRVGRRFVADLAASRCPSYVVKAVDSAGNEWEQVLTIYQERLSPQTKEWWYSRLRKNT